ncbi:hypothetical protein FH581_000135 [Leptospira weilii]|uniref:hypothetical protein n=1 Tax=Leptospira weilii TaxID=28184 RepID=UPI0002E943E0|nr:hypothetical protein [Leptospira weilii]UPY77263.1 hypothetical protein FH581_015150 [Leptospira weilii]UPY77299.1 hypothetical protein FH581_000135 [Leptospira weilii]
MKFTQLRFITDHKGKKLSVILPIKEFKTLLKELENAHRSRAKEKEPTKKEILAGITQGMKEAQLHRQGKLKLKSTKELLDEL